MEIENEKKFLLSDRKISIMAEALGMKYFFLCGNVSHKLLKQMHKANLCGKKYITGNIVLKMPFFIRISYCVVLFISNGICMGIFPKHWGNS